MHVLLWPYSIREIVILTDNCWIDVIHSRKEYQKGSSVTLYIIQKYMWWDLRFLRRRFYRWLSFGMLRPKVWGFKIFWNVGNFILQYTAHLRRQSYSRTYIYTDIYAVFRFCCEFITKQFHMERNCLPPSQSWMTTPRLLFANVYSTYMVITGESFLNNCRKYWRMKAKLCASN